MTEVGRPGVPEPLPADVLPELVAAPPRTGAADIDAALDGFAQALTEDLDAHLPAGARLGEVLQDALADMGRD